MAVGAGSDLCEEVRSVSSEVVFFIPFFFLVKRQPNGFILPEVSKGVKDKKD